MVWYDIFFKQYGTSSTEKPHGEQKTSKHLTRPWREDFSIIMASFCSKVNAQPQTTQASPLTPGQSREPSIYIASEEESTVAVSEDDVFRVPPPPVSSIQTATEGPSASGSHGQASITKFVLTKDGKKLTYWALKSILSHLSFNASADSGRVLMAILPRSSLLDPQKCPT